MKVKHPAPSDLMTKSFRTTVRRTSKGIHAFDTEVRTLEQACDLIAARQRAIKSGAGVAKAATEPSLRAELAKAASRARLQKMHGKISLAGGVTNNRDPRMPRKRPNSPHPYADLSLDQQRAKVREMSHGGFWGLGPPMHRRLAKLFQVPVGQIIAWLED